MKNLLALMLCFSLLSLNLHSQVAFTSYSKKVVEKKVTQPSPRLIQAHTNDAVEQLTEHLSEAVTYPEVMEDILKNETLILGVRLDENGFIKHFKVLSEAPAAFVDAVNEAVLAFDQVEIKSPDYYGARRINIPIQFTIDNK